MAKLTNAELTLKLEELEKKFATLQKDVRESFEELVAEGYIGADSANAYLEEVGLPPILATFTGEQSIKVRFSGVESTNSDDAADSASALIYEAVNSGIEAFNKKNSPVSLEIYDTYTDYCVKD